MADSRRHAVRGFPWLTASLLAAGAAVSLAAVASSVLTVVVARTVVTPPRRRPEDVVVLSVDLAASTITLDDTADALLPGEYSFWFAAETGHAKLGEIIARSGHTVTRRVISVDSGDLTKATRGRISGWFFLTPAELGVPVEDVAIATEFGPAPAWLVPAAGPSTRWVIQVHGRAVRRAETIRAVPVFRDAGYTSLLISYRNDGDAPPSLDGRYGLGDTEWRDVEAAIQYALDHGATDVVLMGWSMGGATVLQAVTRSPLAGVVRGLVLDSPVVDWVTALRFQGTLLGLPGPVWSGVISLIGSEWARRLTGQSAAIDIGRLDFVRRSDELDLPILLMHSDDDGFVPSTASRALAEARPDIVTFESFSGARHTKLWNYDPPRWNAAIAHWLATAPLAVRGD
ncbi:alpha/beta hydrolase family protein [Lacisediminihabitans sp.]|uniref:alpha/beta hydrolase family protein n=1 Tax=Lacisediminihabitans sp. TaxID=2787631 RepID=UPI00374D3817